MGEVLTLFQGLTKLDLHQRVATTIALATGGCNTSIFEFSFHLDRFGNGRFGSVLVCDARHLLNASVILCNIVKLALVKNEQWRCRLGVI